MQENQGTFFGLHFESQGTDNAPHVASAQAVADAIDGLERTVHVAAMMHTGHEMKSGFRIPRAVRNHFILRWKKSEKGSFCLPTHIDGMENASPTVDFESVAGTVRDAMKAANMSDRSSFKKAVFKRAFRGPMIDSLGRMFGGASKNNGLEVRDSVGNTLARSSIANETLGGFANLRRKPYIHSVATGYVDKLDFKKQQLYLRTPSPNRILHCQYETAMQPLLLENRRNLVHVDGKIELDQNDDPVRILEVSGIRNVDTSDINVADLLPDYLEQNCSEDMYVRVTLSDCKQIYSAEMEELELFQAAHTREELVDIMESWFHFLWQQYALADDSTLTDDAVEYKATLKKLFRET